MIQNKSIVVLFLLLTFFAQSCSTIGIHTMPTTDSSGDVVLCKAPPYIYGGAITDIALLAAIVSDDSHESAAGKAISIVAVVVYVVIDLPLSLVADTIILPLSIYRQISECVAKTKAENNLASMEQMNYFEFIKNQTTGWGRIQKKLALNRQRLL